MSWIAFDLAVTPAELPGVEELFTRQGAQSISLTNPDETEVEPVLEPTPGQAPLWELVHMRALFPDDADLSGLRDALHAHDPALHERIEYQFVSEEDWSSASWQEAPDQVFAGRLRLRPRSRRGQDESPDLENLYLDAGLAFGSGTHPTTQLCLEAVAELAQPGLRVLDFGCGSGILGVAAALLGSRVFCVDHDPQAVVAARENALYNGLDEETISIMHTDAWAAERFEDQFELVVANILAGPLAQLAASLQSVLAPDGTLVLSGLLEAQAADVAPHYAAVDFLEPETQAGWTRLMGHKRGG